VKFTIATKTIIKMVKTVGKKMPGQKKADPNVRVFACSARVFVESNQTVDGVEALVFADGQFTMPYDRFQFLLDTFKTKKHFTLEVDQGRMHIGTFSQPVPGYLPHALPPGKFVVFPVTDLGVLPNNQTPIGGSPRPVACDDHLKTQTESMAEKPSPVILQVLGQAAAALARKLYSAEDVSPKMVVGLARATFALEKLPRFTAGVDVLFSASLKDTIPGGYEESGFYVHVSGDVFEVGHREMLRRGTSFRDDFLPSYSKRCSESPEDEELDWVGVDGWIEDAGLYAQHASDGTLNVRVHDQSKPKCLT